MSALTCPACGELAGPDDKFCEACGTPFNAPAVATAAAGPEAVAADPVAPAPVDPVLDPVLDPPTVDVAIVAAPTPAPVLALAPGVRPCVRCGGAIAVDGYCEQCGEPAASERDHFTSSPASWVGGVCDRGVVHHRNEDAMALALPDPDGDVAVLVVCDGVSSSPDSDVASLAAAKAAVAAVLAEVRNADTASAEQIRALSGILGRAAVAANDAVVATTRTAADVVTAPTAAPAVAAEATDTAKVTDPTPGEATTAEPLAPHASENPPSCTFVAAVVDGPLIVTAWIGDSRAYWLPDDGTPRQLSVDHSWAQEMIALGMPRAEAETARHAHAITRWLGADAPDTAARTDAMVAGGPGWLLVCSDGLWNYCSPAADMGALLTQVRAAVGEDPTVIAAELVRWANAQGGRDNITATLARITPDGPGGHAPSPESIA